MVKKFKTHVTGVLEREREKNKIKMIGIMAKNFTNIMKVTNPSSTNQRRINIKKNIRAHNGQIAKNQKIKKKGTLSSGKYQ